MTREFFPRVVLYLGFMNFLGVVVLLCVFVLKKQRSKYAGARNFIYYMTCFLLVLSLSLSRSLCFFILCD